MFLFLVENIVDNQKCQARFRPLCNKICSIQIQIAPHQKSKTLVKRINKNDAKVTYGKMQVQGISYLISSSLKRMILNGYMLILLFVRAIYNYSFKYDTPCIYISIYYLLQWSYSEPSNIYHRSSLPYQLNRRHGHISIFSQQNPTDMHFSSKKIWNIQPIIFHL